MSDTQNPPASPPPLPDARAIAPVNRRRWWFHLLIIGSYPPLVGLLREFEGAQMGPALSHTVRGLMLVCLVELVVFGLWFLLGWIASRATWDDLLLRWRQGVWTVPLGLGYSIALRIGVGLVAIMAAVALVATHVMAPTQLKDFVEANRPKVETLVDVTALRDNPAYFWLTVTLVSFVVAGLREELWRAAVLAGMRKLWPRTFGSGAGQTGAVMVAAVCFGFGHLSQGWLAVGMTTVLGFGLGMIMVLHRSLWPAVIAHGAFDATSIALLPWLMEKIPHLPPLTGH